MYKILKISIRGLAIASFLIVSSPAYAVYMYNVADGGNNNYRQTAQLACQAFAGGDQPYISATETTCTTAHPDLGTFDRPINKVFYASLSCTAPYSDDGTGHCVEQVQCPAQDTSLSNYQHSLTLDTDAIIDVDGCGYQSVSVSACYKSNDEWLCTSDLVATGLESPPNSISSSSAPTPSNLITSDAESVNDTVITPTQTSTMPDGTIVETDSKVVTDIHNQGITVNNADSSITIVDSDGTTTIYSENKVKTIKPDGTVTEVITKDTTVNTGQKTVGSISTSTGNVTSNTTNSTTTNNNQTTTNNYDSSGNLTSTTTSQTGTGQTADTGDKNQEGNCGAPGQPSCDVNLAGSDQLTNPNDVLIGSGITETLDGQISRIESIGQDDISDNILENPFEISGTGQCNASSYSTTYKDSPFNPMETFCDAYDSTLHPILRFFFYMLTLIVLYKIYLSTVLRT